MRWYMTRNGETTGPFEGSVIVQWIQEGRVLPATFVRDESGGPWIPFEQATFDPNPAGAAQARTVQADRARARTSTISTRAVLTAIAALVIVVLSFAKAWFGLLCGLSLIVWTAMAHRKGTRVPLALVLNKVGSVGWTIGTLAFAALLVLGGISAYGRGIQNRKDEEQRLASARANEEAQRTRRKDLEQQLPGRIGVWTAKLAGALRTADSTSVKDGLTGTASVQTEIGEQIRSVGAPTPDSLASVARAAESQRANLQSRADVLDGVASIDGALSDARDAIKQKRWLDADHACDRALTAISAAENVADPLRAYLPKDFDAKRKRAEAQQLKRVIAGPVAQEKRRLELEEKKRKQREAYIALCGPAPTISPWDGEAVGLESELKETAHDPDSIDVEHCSEPELTAKVCWLVSCNVRGKNMFGALILQRKTFSYSKALGFQEVR